MSRPRTHEQRLLTPATQRLSLALQETGAPNGAAIEVLEAVAASSRRWSLEEYRNAFPAEYYLPVDTATLWGDYLAEALPDGKLMPLPLAVAALAQPTLSQSEQRKAGAYYTDFRLAQYLASQFNSDFGQRDLVIDLASGSGMLLAALALHVSAGDPVVATNFVANNVCAADLHFEALRATRVALAATIDDLSGVVKLSSRLLQGDSLTRSADDWEAIAPGGFAAVIGNPPWEKLRVTRHEVLTGAGVKRHYGALYEEPKYPQYDSARREMVAYVQELVGRSEMQGKGEADMYKLFLELGVRVLRPRGQLGLFVPAGLIRSKGTETLRAFLLRQAPQIGLTIFENRASFFAIDSRFKFLSVHALMGGGATSEPLTLRHADGAAAEVVVTSEVTIDRKDLVVVRPDLTVPEVRDRAQWTLFQRLVTQGTSLEAPEWAHSYQRELDMTNDRQLFHATRGGDRLPLIEGRMVQQHRVMAKAHLHGTGRAAVWKPLGFGQASLRPQFWVDQADLSPALRQRIAGRRAGFCDVTGQTNERTLIATVVPAGVVCGNKVPTLTFDDSPLGAEKAALAWSALANSFTVDWAARRVVTTSMNYFLLRSLPLPRLSRDALTRVAKGAQLIHQIETTGASAWEIGTVRAELDAEVAQAFGLTPDDLALIFTDFKLLDRGQPALPGESRSTITRDLVLTTLADRRGDDSREWGDRLSRGRIAGAVPYVPAEYVATLVN
ncbi:Eco57I restriction-modification methylase domain-containing protein [Microbacteriaceae bacterium 4G12]